ncbi:MAG: zinc-binding dehydrogenase [Halieaceae bacterium]|nr:zinc-binding dehydrogenase [Halieaceae bacterium]
MTHIPKTMIAAVTTGTGGYEKLEIREIPTPKIRSGEVLVKVLAAGVNNTDINTRLGWYSDRVKNSTTQLSVQANKKSHDTEKLSGWNSKTIFPLIQGTDCCGVVVKAADLGAQNLVGKRVIIRPCTNLKDPHSVSTSIWMGSDFNGSFANFVSVSIKDTFPILSNLTDAELGSIPCAFGTAENMLIKAGVTNKHHLLVTGGSGGVGTALIRLAKLRGAKVTAISSREKVKLVKELGCNEIINRSVPKAIFLEQIKERKNSFDVVADTVGGSWLSKIFDTIQPGGKYVCSGAIAGPIVNLDLRKLYLKDITAIGSTSWIEESFLRIVDLIESKEIDPLVHNSFSLTDIVKAQKLFIKTKPFGKIVLIPPE